MLEVYHIFASNFVIADSSDDAEGPRDVVFGNGVVASSMGNRLKSELLANLNKYSDKTGDELEVTEVFILGLENELEEAYSSFRLGFICSII